jgi:hypothetical protein
MGSARPGARVTPRRPLVAPILPVLRQAPVRGSVKILSSGNAAVRKQRRNFVRTRRYSAVYRFIIKNQRSLMTIKSAGYVPYQQICNKFKENPKRCLLPIP